MATTMFDLDRMFAAPEYTLEQQAKIDVLRTEGKNFAKCILDHVPECYLRQHAIGEVKNAVENAISALRTTT
jgi:hypothetical protein